MLFKNIHQLLQIRPVDQRWVAGSDMAELPHIEDAFLITEGDRIVAFGPMAKCPASHPGEVIDATGRILLPAWCDSHTHLVYAGNRENEWLARLQGHSYAEIAANGGGILNSARLLNETSEEELYEQSRHRLEAVMRMGTGAAEIKSGYGLTVEGELKMLRVIRRLKENYPVAIKATFLGAHALPAIYQDDKATYLRVLIDKLLPRIAKEGLADYVDVFCEKGYFSVADTIQLMEAGNKHGLQPKIHVNQFTALGGVAAAVANNALSVDHLEELMDADITALQDSQTMPVALPGCSFFLRIPYTPARRLLAAGLPLALATDYNPGSAPSGNMNLVVSLACSQMGLLPAEAINAATLNGAYAMGLETELGSVTVGKRANLLLSEPLPSFTALPYSFGENLLTHVMIGGNFIPLP
ncbi:MAG: imidazolonepropionase [Bacteroidota bacterium]